MQVNGSFWSVRINLESLTTQEMDHERGLTRPLGIEIPPSGMLRRALGHCLPRILIKRVTSKQGTGNAPCFQAGLPYAAINQTRQNTAIPSFLAHVLVDDVATQRVDGQQLIDIACTVRTPN
jgi:hypothetical protein